MAVLRCQRARRDSGAVAIVVAIVAVVLFGAAALAVELTDMFSRDRAVQTTADLAALAGAQELPDACAAFSAALANLNDAKNGVRTDSGTSAFAATAVQMSDRKVENGEIQVLGPTANVIPLGSCPTTTTTTARKIRVITPPRDVRFAFGAAIKGASGGDVQGVAAVELRGLDVSVLPLSLPSNCPSGPNYLYVDNGGVSGVSSGDVAPAYSPSGNTNGPQLTSLTANDPDLPTKIRVVATNLREDPRASGMGVIFDFHLLTDSGTLRAPGPAPSGISGVAVAAGQLGRNNWQATFDVDLPSVVTTTPGSWKVRGLQAGGANKWTPDDAVRTLVVGLPSIAGCPNPSTGDFGLLNSPRADGGSQAQQRFRNFARGIDHNLMTVADTRSNTPCVADRDPYADGILDDNTPARGDESCIDVKPGESASLPTDGIVDGRGGEPGRFVGTPSVSSGTGSRCRVAGDDDLRWTSKSGKALVNTVLSCYLSSGSSLADVAAGVPGSLTADIATDPRFFYIPVTDTTYRPPNAAQGAQYWPVKSFRGAFATNERLTDVDDAGGGATCNSFSDCNGLYFNTGGTQLKAIQAFTFPLSALPKQVDQPGNGGDYYGGTKDFLLVE